MTSFKECILGNLPGEESLGVWVQKINGIFSLESAAQVAPVIADAQTNLSPGFYLVDNCVAINYLRNKYDSKEQFAIDFLASLNKAQEVDHDTFEEISRHRKYKENLAE